MDMIGASALVPGGAGGSGHTAKNNGDGEEVRGFHEHQDHVARTIRRTEPNPLVTVRTPTSKAVTSAKSIARVLAGPDVNGTEATKRMCRWAERSAVSERKCQRARRPPR